MGERRPDHGIKLHTTRLRLNSFNTFWAIFPFKILYCLSRHTLVQADFVHSTYFGIFAAFLGLVRKFPGVLPRVSDPQLFEKDATMCDEPKQV